MAISSTSAAQGAASLVWQQLQLQQAQKNAERAEQSARTLRRQASEAQRAADGAQENARTLKVESGRADATADLAKRGVAGLASVAEMKTQLSDTYTRVAAAQKASDAAEPQAVVNTAGQTTGTVISTTA